MWFWMSGPGNGTVYVFYSKHSIEVCAFSSKHSMEVCAFYSKHSFVIHSPQHLPANANCSKSKRIWQISGWSFRMLKARSLNYMPRRERESTQSLRELTASCSICCWIKRTSESDTHFVTQLIHALSNVTPQEHFAIFSFQRYTRQSTGKTHPSCLDDSD